jgi:ribosome recycling factor
MESSLGSLQSEFSGLRAGRANPGMLEPITVDAYGSKMPLNQIGNISATDARMLTVSVWDASMAPAVEKAIRESDLGLNPMAEGGVIRVPIPDLSEERRKDMVKVAGRYAEACRVAVRNIRRDGIETVRKAEKGGFISEDDRHHQEAEVQKITDAFVKKVDDALICKEKEIIQV